LKFLKSLLTELKNMAHIIGEMVLIGVGLLALLLGTWLVGLAESVLTLSLDLAILLTPVVIFLCLLNIIILILDEMIVGREKKNENR